ncbi:MAG: hypothetical protein ACTHJK_01630 [Sphingomicrobium sp.]|jgi:hypothetical protein
MIWLYILFALVLAFGAFKLVKGMIKLGLLAVIGLFCIFAAHQAGAF